MRVRVRFSKLGKVRFTSHRDVARIWERVFRKASIPVAYSEGFSPRPRLAFGLALPTGAESLAELIDIELVGEFDPEELRARLDQAMPGGFDIMCVVPIDRAAPSLQEDVVACTWEMTVRDRSVDQVRADIDAALTAASLPLERERKGEKRVDDVRPAIESLVVHEVDGTAVLSAVLATRPRGLRPGELFAVCFPDAAEPGDLAGRVLRTNQIIERDGARQELLPFEADASRVPLGARA